ncbi:hypothetical protein [Pelagicoccus sp. SDUM812003]|uniref:hypothetical protein n=1 Tax=Pelagicoccus sp. SDUM812003 TaxID=3041267 RepID=UPI0028102DF5|nr:hypothetical protein [Pelagicoccus sp. SDUM812003]MDQ8204116.1 hypothetical protein [Pelagicoccus sp. SDUM812003]
MKSNATRNRTNPWRFALAALAAVSLIGGAFAKASPAKGEKAEDGPRLVVQINDLQGMAEFGSEYARENLLRAAFYEASRRADWLGDYDFEYNRNRDAGERGLLEFNVLHWKRSPAGTYNFTASVAFTDLDGNKTNLGTVQGMRTSIDVFNRWDVSEKFADSAEDAFNSALRKLKTLENA